LEGQIANGKLWADDVVPRPQIQIGLTSTPEERIKSGDDLLQQTRRSLAKKS
jgi:hypothetical protein